MTIPVILDDCEVPLFLRDKYHADFRNDFDQELKRLQDSLLKYTDISLNRVENLKYHIDWAIDHGIIDDHVFINVDSISFSKEHEYSVLCNIMVVGNSKATALYKLAHSKGEACAFIDEFVSILLKMSPRPDFHVLLDSNLPSIEESQQRTRASDTLSRFRSLHGGWALTTALIFFLTMALFSK